MYWATSQVKSFHSVNYPGNHPNSLNCVTRITADPGQVIQITFETIHLEDGYDFVEVRTNFRFR